MRKNYYLVMSLAAVAALSSCKKLGELSADNFTVTPTPLEAIACLLYTSPVRCLPLSTVNFPRSI